MILTAPADLEFYDTAFDGGFHPFHHQKVSGYFNLYLLQVLCQIVWVI